MDMRHHRLGLGAVVDLLERVHDFVLAEWTAVELVDALIDHHAGLLLHELRELTGVVLLDRHDALRRTEDRADGFRGERPHEPALQEVDLLPLRLEVPQRVEDRALRRAPGEDGEVGAFRPVQEVLLLLRHRLLQQLQLVHALVHHRDAHLDALGDVTIGVVLVAGDPVAATRDAGTRSRGDPILRERVAEIFLHVREIHLPVAIPVVAGLATRVVWPLRVHGRPLAAGEDLTAVNIWPAEFELVDRRIDRRELLVGQHDDRHLVPLGPVEGGERVLVALTQVAGRDDHVRELALRWVQRELEVTLLLPRGHAGRGAAALVHDQHGPGAFGDRREANSLDHEGEAGTARGGGCAYAHVRGADGHVDRGDLVLALDHEQVVLALLPLEVDALVGRGRDGVVGLERAARLELRDRVDLVALREDARLRLAAGLECVWELLRVLVLLYMLEGELRGPHVQLANLRALALELGADDFGDEIEWVIAERERRAQADRVLHDLIPPRLLALTDLFERLLDDLHKGHRVEAQIRTLGSGRVEADLTVEDHASTLVDLAEVSVVRGPAAVVAVAGEGLLVQRNEDVGLVLVRAHVLVVDANAIEGVLAHDVRVVFDVRVDAEARSGAGFGEHFGGCVDPTTLGAADHPGQSVLLHFGMTIVRS